MDITGRRQTRYDDRRGVLEFLDGGDVVDRVRLAKDASWSDMARLSLRWTLDGKTPAIRIREIIDQIRREEGR